MSNRTVLKLSGADCVSFLQGLVTNDVSKPDGLVYSALLTPQGKFIADFFVQQDGVTILLDVATSHAPALFQKLSMYRLRADVQIEDSGFSVSNGVGTPPDGAFSDPRHPDLGWRHIHQGTAQTTDLIDLRVTHCIPETGIELTPDTYILEAGFERLNGVDFRKGCFIGQEIVARMKHKTELRKGLRKMAISGAAPVGSDITADGKLVGTLFTQSNGHAIAHVRLDRSAGTLRAGDATLSFAQ